MSQQSTEAGTPAVPFDPRAHITNIKGGRYLPVSARLIWFRQEHPNADINTEIHTLNERIAVFVCRITIPDGGSATGWGSCTPQQFSDGFVEKAETKARGRALAALGYATPEDDDEGDQIADAPIRSQQRPAQQNDYQQRAQQPAAMDDPMTAAQRSRITRLAHEAGIPEGNQFAQWLYEELDIDWAYITKRQASRVIDHLEAMRPASAQQQRPAQQRRDVNPVTGEVMPDISQEVPF